VRESAVTNSRFCCASRATGRPFPPLDHARSTPQTARSSRAGIRRTPHKRGGLPSAARRRDVALRLRFARRCSPPSAPLSPLTDHRPKQADLPRKTGRSSACGPAICVCGTSSASSVLSWIPERRREGNTDGQSCQTRLNSPPRAGGRGMERSLQEDQLA